MSDPNPDSELIARVCEAFEKRIPFNQVLGLRLEEVSAEQARLAFDMREELRL